MVEEFIKLKKEANERMDKTINFLKDELKKVRTGRATVGMVEDIRFDYYGNMSPIKQAASLSTPDPHTIVIDPWDKSIIKSIEKGIVESGFTEETKKEYVKKLKEIAEEAKIAIRNERRDINDKVKKFSKEGHISEDEEKKELDEIQKVTDNHIKLIDELVAKKEKEIMEI